jgi:hypothetical protein
VPVFEHEHVFGLEIAVHDAACVRRFQAARDLSGYGKGFADRQRCPVDDVAERLAFEQLGDRGYAQVVDFGLAKLAEPTCRRERLPFRMRFSASC